MTTINHDDDREDNIAVACRRRKKSFSVTHGNQRRHVDQMSDKVDDRRCMVQDEHCSDEDKVHYIYQLVGRKPYMIHLSLNGTQIRFEIDAGSGITIVSEETYLQSFGSICSPQI